MPQALAIEAVDHIGLRVANAERAEAFYALLGFAVTFRSSREPVVILRNASGIELNLIVNADPALDGSNVLMDVPDKRAGITHFALRVPSIEATERTLRELAIEITEGPVRLGEGVSLFVRDPDRNVIELRSPAR
jgi:lactoylglutathione lyase